MSQFLLKIISFQVQIKQKLITLKIIRMQIILIYYLLKRKKNIQMNFYPFTMVVIKK